MNLELHRALVKSLVQRIVSVTEGAERIEIPRSDLEALLLLVVETDVQRDTAQRKPFGAEDSTFGAGDVSRSFDLVRAAEALIDSRPSTVLFEQRLIALRDAVVAFRSGE